MNMNKNDRELIFSKYGGRCAYCGCELQKGWQVDHLEPVERTWMREQSYYTNIATGQIVESKDRHTIPRNLLPEYTVTHPLPEFKMKSPERDTFENLMPSCPSCNNYKHSFSLEEFRKQVGLLVSRLNSTFTQYRIARRYGLVLESNIEVKFYFETVNEMTTK